MGWFVISNLPKTKKYLCFCVKTILKSIWNYNNLWQFNNITGYKKHHDKFLFSLCVWWGNNKFPFSSNGAQCCWCCTPRDEGTFSNWRVEPCAVSWSWDPFRAATGEDLFVPTSEFSAENNENPGVCPEMTKSFASVEKWTTILKRKRGEEKGLAWRL